MSTTRILSDLIAFPTISADANLDLVKYSADHLSASGARVEIIKDATGQKANLYATIGPENVPGVLLSGHTDVVPVESQEWTYPPFEATTKDGRVYGRGTADMKGFVASALFMAQNAGETDLTTPLHIALSYDEEIGCVGVHSMIDMLKSAPFVPRFCIVGEPTQMGVATGHKGKTAFRVTCKGQEAHSALAPNGLNAIYMATDMIAAIRKIQAQIISNGATDDDYDVGYSTLHVGTIEGGTALNIVPNRAEFLAEIRNLVDDEPGEILNRIKDCAAKISAEHQDKFPCAKIDLEVTNTYPPLGTSGDTEVVAFVKSLTGANQTSKVAFGTEGGIFNQVLGIPTVICGPGSMEQGHKPDEYISLSQLNACDSMLANLLKRLQDGL